MDAWFEGEVAHSDIRENAAVLAAAEWLLGADVDGLLSAYLSRHPEREGTVDSVRAVVLRLGRAEFSPGDRPRG